MTNQLNEAIESAGKAVADVITALTEDIGRTAHYLTSTPASSFSANRHATNLAHLAKTGVDSTIHLMGTYLDNLALLVAEPPQVWISRPVRLPPGDDLTRADTEVRVVEVVGKPYPNAHVVGLDDTNISFVSVLEPGQEFRVLLIQPVYTPSVEEFRIASVEREAVISAQMFVSPDQTIE